MIDRAFYYAMHEAFDLFLAWCVIQGSFNFCNQIQKHRLNNTYKYSDVPILEKIIAPIIWVMASAILMTGVFFLRVRGDTANYFDWRYCFTGFFMISISGLIGILMAYLKESEIDKV
ncbi:MAG: hypothetical protein KAY50_04165 [Chitinophagaceae bacterium]|nr:hypothetical protein [Chitinophagaceae bacterium]